MVDAKLWLFRFCVFLVAREGQLSVVFIPGESLVFSLAVQESDRLGIGGIGTDGVNSVGFFFLRRDCEYEGFCVFADGEIESVDEGAFTAGGRVAEDEIASVLLFLAACGS